MGSLSHMPGLFTENKKEKVAEHKQVKRTYQGIQYVYGRKERGRTCWVLVVRLRTMVVLRFLAVGGVARGTT